MNRLIKSVVVFSFAILCFAAQAQVPGRNPQLQQRLIQAKLMEIKKALALSDAEMNQLTPVYRRYEEEKLSVRFPQQGQLLRTSIDSLSHSEADKLIAAHLDNAVRMSTIRRKYYNEFREVLSPQQVVQLYRSDAMLNKKVMQEMRRRMNNRMN